MKIIKKYVISLMLCLTILLSVVPTTVKAETINDKKYIVQKAYDFMQIALSESDMYGLQCSEDDIYISQYIPAYTTNNGIVSMSNEVGFYFILENGEPVAELTVISNPGDIKPCIQFSTDLANSYQNFDEESFTIVLGEERPYFANLGETDTLIFSDVLIKNTNPDNQISPLSSYPSSYFVSVPIKPQGSNSLCWAACVASVGQYKTEKNRSAKQVANEMGIDYDAGSDLSLIIDGLGSIYGIAAYEAGGVLLTESVADVLMAGGGVIAICYTDDAANGHAVVVCGYSANSSGCTYKIMDPNRSYISMMISGTDSSGNSTFCFSYSGIGTFHWVNSVYCY